MLVGLVVLTLIVFLHLTGWYYEVPNQHRHYAATLCTALNPEVALGSGHATLIIQMAFNSFELN